MRVFLSWSGTASGEIARVLAEGLPQFIPSIEPFLATRDIQAGTSWVNALEDAWKSADVALLCITDENSPWMLFEAGMFSASPQNATVIPFLVGLGPSDLRGPLAQFQAATPERPSVIQLVQAICRRDPDSDEELAKRAVIQNYDRFIRDIRQIVDERNRHVHDLNAAKMRAAESAEEEWRRVTGD